jgi:hypothetical protein
MTGYDTTERDETVATKQEDGKRVSRLGGEGTTERVKAHDYCKMHRARLPSLKPVDIDTCSMTCPSLYLCLSQHLVGALGEIQGFKEHRLTKEHVSEGTIRSKHIGHGFSCRI